MADMNGFRPRDVQKAKAMDKDTARGMQAAMRRHEDMLAEWKAAGHPEYACIGHAYPHVTCPAPGVHDAMYNNTYATTRNHGSDASGSGGSGMGRAYADELKTLATAVRSGDSVAVFFNMELTDGTAKHMMRYLKKKFPGVEWTFFENTTGVIVQHAPDKGDADDG